MAKTENTETKKDSFITSVIRFFSDQRTKYGMGIFLLALTAYLSLCFISFFFTGAADDSIIQHSFFDLTPNEKKAITNWAGPAGAYFANFFINKSFGIASFSFLFLTFVIALRLMKVQLVKLWKAFTTGVIVLIWFSVSITFFFFDFYKDTKINWGGEHGFAINEYLLLNIGKLGTFLMILSTFIIFCIFAYSGTIPFLQRTVAAIAEKFKKLFSKKEKIATAAFENGEENQIANEIDAPQPETEEIFDEEFDETEEEEEEESSINTWKVTTDTDEEFEIIVPKDEEVLDNEKPVDNETYDASTLGEYDPTKDLSKYKYPTIDLLKDYGSSDGQVNIEEQNSNKNRITTTLKNYGIEIETIKATVGPTITLYEIVPKAGVRISKIKNLESDIMLSLAATGIRIIAPIPGKGTIGIEVPNNDPQTVSMLSIINSKKFKESTYGLPIAFGRTITNDIFMVDLCKMPHMLVAGATGQGKSVGLNAIITSLLYKKHPSELKFVLIDPKKVEFNIYSKIERHFLAKIPDSEDAIITDVTKVVQTLNSLTKEMDDRYDLLKKAHTRNLSEYNDKFIHRHLNPEKGHRFLPYIVVIIDEFGDLIMVAGKEVEMPIARIAQLARAVGIHMIIATQRPSVNIITGVIKANFPARVAFRVSSQIDSRTILDATGANQLVGRGDMLFSQGSDLVRVQCAFVDTPEVEQISDYIGNQMGYPSAFMLPEYAIEGGEGSDLSDVDLSKRDPMFEDAARLLVAHQQGSTSLIQRKFAIGYNRAGRIMDQLEAAGIVGPFEGSKARQVLIPDDYSLEQKLNSL
ncbi:MAG: DNA translocase FtsK 4TM domain-containing protein [Paludibacteraceae bacterium]|nr:DNA translocase FtsK 4TM domain-containing protein [Paludibacteraceae bacterium]MBN2786908.1 DNA translocase FtsK 4TM domain-containing protein [Paludibacteraceae bacterium]